MPTTISGTTGVSQIQDDTVTSAKIVAATIVAGDLDTSVVPLGVGQTWQDVAGSRVAGTTYYNTTGRSICVSTRLADDDSGIINISVNGIYVSEYKTNNTTGGAHSSISAIIPPGASYVVGVSVATVGAWVELR